MKLKQLIDLLESIENKCSIVKKGFAYPHSWRGIYSELSFAPKENISIQSMLDCAKSAIGKTYEGWEGGDFTMDENTDVHISPEGDSEDFLGETLFSIGQCSNH